jgi:1,4-alpha-glucan branching enzyme
VGLPRGGHWKEALNSNAGIYGGSNSGNGGGIHAQPVPSHAHAHSAEFFLPPLSIIVFQSE